MENRRKCFVNISNTNLYQNKSKTSHDLNTSSDKSGSDDSFIVDVRLNLHKNKTNKTNKTNKSDNKPLLSNQSTKNSLWMIIYRLFFSSIIENSIKAKVKTHQRRSSLPVRNSVLISSNKVEKGKGKLNSMSSKKDFGVNSESGSEGKGYVDRVSIYEMLIRTRRSNEIDRKHENNSWILKNSSGVYNINKYILEYISEVNQRKSRKVKENKENNEESSLKTKAESMTIRKNRTMISQSSQSKQSILQKYLYERSQNQVKYSEDVSLHHQKEVMNTSFLRKYCLEGLDLRKITLNQHNTLKKLALNDYSFIQEYANHENIFGNSKVNQGFLVKSLQNPSLYSGLLYEITDVNRKYEDEFLIERLEMFSQQLIEENDLKE